jgi:hypothetical protein
MSSDFPAPLSAADLLVAIRSDLCTAPFITDPNSQVRIAQDPGDLLDQLLDKPTGFRVVLHWAGDKPQTDQPLAGIVDHSIEIWVIKPKGLLLNPGDLYITSQGGQPPFLQLIDNITAWVRSNAMPDQITSRYFEYRGAEQLDPMAVPNMETAAFKLSFSITAAKPRISLRNLTT